MHIAIKKNNKILNTGKEKRRGVWLRVIVCCALLGIGIATGMTFSRTGKSLAPSIVSSSLGSSSNWIEEACANYRTFGPKYQPMIDIGPDDHTSISDLVRRTTGLEMTLPSFNEGDRIFEGARIVVINKLPSVELFYRGREGDLLSIFIIAQPQSARHELTDVQETIRDDLTVAWWQGEQALFAIVGPSSDADMPTFASSAYLAF